MSVTQGKKPSQLSAGIGVYDLETDPFAKGEIPKAFAAGVLDPKGNYVHFWGPHCVVRLVAYMLAHPGRYYAHNGGRFDLDFLLRCKALPFSESEVVRVGGRVVKIDIGDLDLRDSYSLLPVALSKVGTGKLDIDIQKMHRSRRAAHKEEILKYLKMDCYSLRNALLRFFGEYGDCMTLAGAAWKTAKERFGIETARLSEEEDATLRRHYFGGRVQVFEGGEVKGPLSLYDINSAYPRAMMEKHFAGSEWTVDDRIPKKPGPWFVEFEGEAIGLPWVNGGKLSFEGHKGRYFATGWEFHQAQPKVIGKPLVYLPDELLGFSDYVEYFYALKAEAKKAGDATGELYAKLLLNSLYGKFGQNPSNYRETRLVDINQIVGDDDADGWETVYESIEAGYAVEEREIPNEKKRYAYKNVGVAASITGYVRAMLARSISESRRPVYCDTDSILCGKFNGTVGDALGEWKHEADIDVAFIAGRKMYALHKAGAKWTRAKAKANDVFVEGYGWTSRDAWKIASKGIGKEITVEDLVKVARGGEVKIERLAPTFSFKDEPRFIKRTVRRT
jgi:hypothetical protein